MAIITTAIGIILVYLILSLIITALQEVIASWFSLRAKHLGHALEKMLTNQQEENGVLSYDKSLLLRFQEHALFHNLRIKKPKANQEVSYPSYMSAATFSTILLHLLDGKDVKSTTATIQKMEDGKLKDFLLHLLEEADMDLVKFRTKLEQWYDSVMSRVSGWYKRYCHNIILGMGFLLAVYLNADTLSVYQKISATANDANQEEAIYGLAQSIVDGGYAQMQQQIDTVRILRDSVLASPDSLPASEVLLQQNLALITEVDSLVQHVQGPTSPLGLGWTQAELSSVKSFDLRKLFLKLMGFILTALAISLGAPFWFDLLKKLINIRNAGPIHQRSTVSGSANKVST